MNTKPATANRKVWIRAGDDDDYRGFAGLADAAAYLATQGVRGAMRAVTSIAKRGRLWGCTLAGIMGVSAPGYRGANYISVYWGSAAEDPTKGLTGVELRQLNRLTKAAWREMRQ